MDVAFIGLGNTGSAMAQGLAESDWSIIARLADQNAGLSEPAA